MLLDAILIDEVLLKLLQENYDSFIYLNASPEHLILDLPHDQRAATYTIDITGCVVDTYINYYAY